MEQSNQNILVPKFYKSVEEQELARLKEAVNRTDQEKFDYLMQLIGLQEWLKQGKVETTKK